MDLGTGSVPGKDLGSDAWDCHKKCWLLVGTLVFYAEAAPIPACVSLSASHLSCLLAAKENLSWSSWAVWSPWRMRPTEGCHLLYLQPWSGSPVGLTV